MCALLALWALLTGGGELFMQLRPLHFVVRRYGMMIHGTNKTGGWAIEAKPWDGYERWLRAPLQWRTRLVRLTPRRERRWSSTSATRVAPRTGAPETS